MVASRAMIESVHASQDEAIAAAIAASKEQGPDGVVVAHERDCKIIGCDESTCSCHPMTLQLGPSA